jgi:hypothetical protein
MSINQKTQLFSTCNLRSPSIETTIKKLVFMFFNLFPIVQMAKGTWWMREEEDEMFTIDFLVG